MGSLPDPAPLIRVLIVGGCYAGIATAVNLSDLAEGYSPRQAREPYLHHPDLPKLNLQITIVDERDGYFHIIGSPLALADESYAEKAWVKFSDIPALQKNYINVIHGSVTSVDPSSKTATISPHLSSNQTSPLTRQYDYLVVASGLRRVWPVVPQSLTRKQYLSEARGHIKAVAAAQDGVLVVGGGAVGIEMAAELRVMKPHLKVTLAHSRDQLLSSEALSDECKNRSLELLRETGVEVLMGHRLATSNKINGEEKYEVEFTNGHTMTANQVIMAMSKSVPSTSYLPSSVLDEDGYVKIRPNQMFPQECPNADYHFCAGDAAKWTGIKRCGGAMHGGHYVAQNIHQSIMRDNLPNHQPKFMQFNEFPPMIGLAIGKNAVASGPQGTTSGPDVMKAYFRDDLGFDICWEYMQLGGRKEA